MFSVGILANIESNFVCVAFLLKPIFENKKTSIEPILRAYINKSNESNNYPYSETNKKQIEKKLSEIVM